MTVDNGQALIRCCGSGWAGAAGPGSVGGLFGPEFRHQCVSDQVRTDLDGKMWVVVDMLAEQSAARRQVEHEGVNRPCVFTRRRRLGVIHAAGSSSVTTDGSPRSQRSRCVHDVHVLAVHRTPSPAGVDRQQAQ